MLAVCPASPRGPTSMSFPEAIGLITRYHPNETPHSTSASPPPGPALIWLGCRGTWELSLVWSGIYIYTSGRVSHTHTHTHTHACTHTHTQTHRHTDTHIRGHTTHRHTCPVTHLTFLFVEGRKLSKCGNESQSQTEGKRRGWQRMRWLDSITDSVDMNSSKLWKITEQRNLQPVGSQCRAGRSH